MRSPHLLQGTLWPAFFFFWGGGGRDSQGVLFTHFLQERPMYAACYSKLFKGWVKPVFRSKWRGQSVKSVCLLHDNARPHTAAVTTRTLEGMHWRYCHTLSMVLTWRQEIFTCSVHWKRPEEGRYWKKNFTMNSLTIRILNIVTPMKAKIMRQAEHIEYKIHT
jgi:hypothetical protein